MTVWGSLPFLCPGNSRAGEAWSGILLRQEGWGFTSPLEANPAWSEPTIGPCIGLPLLHACSGPAAGLGLCRVSFPLEAGSDSPALQHTVIPVVLLYEACPILRAPGQLPTQPRTSTRIPGHCFLAPASPFHPLCLACHLHYCL